MRNWDNSKFTKERLSYHWQQIHTECNLANWQREIKNLFEFQQHRVIWEFLIWIIHWGRQGETNAHSAHSRKHSAQCTDQTVHSVSHRAQRTEQSASGSMVWGQLRLMQAFPAFSDAPRYTALYQLFFKHSPNPQNCTTCSLYYTVYSIHWTTPLRDYDCIAQSVHVSSQWMQVHRFPLIVKSRGGGSVAN